jgi:hypothetical protein
MRNDFAGEVPESQELTTVQKDLAAAHRRFAPAPARLRKRRTTLLSNGMLDHTKTFELHIQEPLNLLEQDWVIGRLHGRRGMQRAQFFGDDGRLRLVVESDAYQLNGSDLMDFLQVCGLHAKLAPVRGGIAPAAPRSRYRPDGL